MDETLVELFAWHPEADCFDGNPMDEFRTTIGDLEYGPDETPATIGLSGGCYMIRFEPGESPASWELLTNLNFVCVISRDRLCIPEDLQQVEGGRVLRRGVGQGGPVGLLEG